MEAAARPGGRRTGPLLAGPHENGNRTRGSGVHLGYGIGMDRAYGLGRNLVKNN
jgi:hypothetical protein